MSGITKITRHERAFAPPDRSRRWKMSPKMTMNTQIAITEKKNTTIAQST
ncbi:MAG TPA: hypothetical protein VF256_06450 [Streptosporangiaceae bacterium]